MIRSIRWRLQLWYAAVLVAVVAGFAAALYFQARADRFRQIDARLDGAARYLDASLRAFPPFEIDNNATRPPKEGPPKQGPPFDKGPKGKGDKKGPPWRPREQLLADLQLQAGDGGDKLHFAVWKADGELVKTAGLPADLPVPAESAFPPANPTLSQRGEWREARLLGPRSTRIVVGQSVAEDEAELAAFAWQLAGLGGVALVVGLAGGWWIAARIVRPLAAISATASSISAANLDVRIDATRVDSELVALAGVLNAMFDRLEREFDRQARFTADASHELRTPLAILRSNVELALSRERSPQEYRETLQTCLGAARRMTGLVDSLLTLARADAGKLELECRPVDLSGVVRECLAQVQPLAQAKELTVRAGLEDVAVRGDRGRLAQVVTNLLTNAIQYNRHGGSLTVALEEDEGAALLSVTDTGCGIPEADQPHVFERFYRVDRARARASGGTGLGLAICKSIVEAHGGTIGLGEREGPGTTVWVRLPGGPVARRGEPGA